MMGDYPCIQLKMMKNGVFGEDNEETRWVEQLQLALKYVYAFKTTLLCPKSTSLYGAHRESGAVHPHRVFLCMY